MVIVMGFVDTFELYLTLEIIVQRRFSDINCDCSRSIVKQKTFRWIQIYLHSTERQAGQDVSINQMSIEKI